MSEYQTTTPPIRSRRYWQTADFWLDGGERVVASFLFTFISLVTIVGFDVTDGKAWSGAAVAAGLSTLKAVVGAVRKDSTTPVSIL